jgi:hypothetical protein
MAPEPNPIPSPEMAQYTLEQYSLREYILTNKQVLPLYYKIYRFVDGQYLLLTTSNLITDQSTTITFDEDGVYRLILSEDETFVSELVVYYLHNITNLVNRKQSFLTDALTKYQVRNCNHNQYYDYITFSILFETYIKLVSDTFMTTVSPTYKSLYKMDYLLSQLNKY